MNDIFLWWLMVLVSLWLTLWARQLRKGADEDVSQILQSVRWHIPGPARRFAGGGRNGETLAGHRAGDLLPALAKLLRFQLSVLRQAAAALKCAGLPDFSTLLQAADVGGRRAGQAGQGIAAFENRNDTALGGLPCHVEHETGQLDVVVIGEFQAAQSVAMPGVEAGRDQHQLRLEAVHGCW